MPLAADILDVTRVYPRLCPEYHSFILLKPTNTLLIRCYLNFPLKYSHVNLLCIITFCKKEIFFAEVLRIAFFKDVETFYLNFPGNFRWLKEIHKVLSQFSHLFKNFLLSKRIQQIFGISFQSRFLRLCERHNIWTRQDIFYVIDKRE